MNSHQRRKARRRARVWLDIVDPALEKPDNTPRDGDLVVKAWVIPGAMALMLCMACGTGIEGDDAGTLVEDAGLTYDGGEPDADAGGLTLDAGPLDACEERQAQWCRQGCIGTIGIDRDCPELDCEC